MDPLGDVLIWCSMHFLVDIEILKHVDIVSES